MLVALPTGEITCHDFGCSGVVLLQMPDCLLCLRPATISDLRAEQVCGIPLATSRDRIVFNAANFPAIPVSCQVDAIAARPSGAIAVPAAWISSIPPQ